MALRYVKNKAIDKWVSLLCRERAEWICERCDRNFTATPGKLDWSHLHSRTRLLIRWSPDNCFAHCKTCHRFFGSNAPHFNDWALERLGEGMMQILKEKSWATKKPYRSERLEILAFYKDQYEKMMQQRADGVTGRIEWQGWY